MHGRSMIFPDGVSSPLRRLLIVGLLGLLALIAINPASARASVNFEVKGQQTCDNRGTVTPLVGARVELWRSISYWPDEKLGATHTNSNGSWSFSVHADNNFDLYAKIVMNDDAGVHLGNWYSFSDESSETGETESHAGVVNLGTWQISRENGKGTPDCAAFQGAHNAYQNYKKIIGSAPPDSSYLISSDFPCCGVPFTTTDTSHWPDGYETGYGPTDPDGGYAVNFHEFAHSVRQSFDGGTLHFLADVVRYGYIKNHELCLLSNEGFAFNEGWAEFWAKTPQTCGDGTNFSIEGNVAAALTSLEKCANRPTMIRVLKENPEAIHSYAQFKEKFFKIVPVRDCTINSITGNLNVEKTIASAQLFASAEGQIAAESQAISGMSKRMALVRTRASKPGKCTNSKCLPGIEKLIQPSVLNTKIAQAELLRERLQSGLAAARSVINGPESAQLKLFETLEKERATFETANQTIVIKGLQQSLAAIKSQPGFAPARNTASFRTINQRLTSLTGAHNRRSTTPSVVATLFSAPQPPGETTQRVSGR
jgi:hypothetical protein